MLILTLIFATFPPLATPLPFPEKDVYWYKLPRAYANDGGFHDPYYNISAVPEEKFGNPNREFPWDTPLGNPTRKENFRYFPKPPRFYRENMPLLVLSVRRLNYSEELRWEFAEGTVFGELLYVNDKPFELRMRTKRGGEWHPTVMRPYTTLPSGGVWIDKTVKASHDFELKGKIYKLPKLDPLTVETLLSGKFKLTREPAPTSDTDSIVPANYFAGILPISQKNCMKCHSDTKKHANEFDYNRDWYGRVRGDDGIFSWHPLTKESISPKGFVIPYKLREIP